MVSHHTVGVADPVILVDDSFQESKKLCPVLIVMKNHHLSDASIDDMI